MLREEAPEEEEVDVEDAPDPHMAAIMRAISDDGANHRNRQRSMMGRSVFLVSCVFGSPWI
jgi:hypothetical protein